jgi:hypothetical protein
VKLKASDAGALSVFFRELYYWTAVMMGLSRV